MSQPNTASSLDIRISPLKLSDGSAVDETVALLSDAFSHEKDPYSWGRCDISVDALDAKREKSTEALPLNHRAWMWYDL
jgi:hypothetical protein